MEPGCTVTVLFVAESDADRSRFMDCFDADSVVLPSVTASADDALDRLESKALDCVVSGGVRTSAGPSLLTAARSLSETLVTILYTEEAPNRLVDEVADVVLRRQSDDTSCSALRSAICEVTGVAGLDDRTDGWRFLGRFSWADRSNVGTTVVERLAEATGQDAFTADPLYDSIDPSALDTLIRTAGERETARPVTVQFSFGNHVVNVSAAGPVWYRPVTA